MAGKTHWEKTFETGRGITHERHWKEVVLQATAWPQTGGAMVLDVNDHEFGRMRIVLPGVLMPDEVACRRGRWRITVEFEPEEER